jgi:hypothetical protein
MNALMEIVRFLLILLGSAVSVVLIVWTVACFVLAYRGIKWLMQAWRDWMSRRTGAKD